MFSFMFYDFLGSNPEPDPDQQHCQGSSSSISVKQENENVQKVWPQIRTHLAL